MTSQPGLQTIAIHILPNISQSKDNQTMKFGKSIEYIREIFFFKYYAANEAGKLVLDLVLLTLIQRYGPSKFLRKGSRTSFSTTFSV